MGGPEVFEKMIGAQYGDTEVLISSYYCRSLV
jgi:hypothetical protein